ncbi:MAG: ABC transporter ATP-binding protein [Micromonosporaceae bacterium]
MTEREFGALLDIEDLRTHFLTDGRVVRAVDSVSCSVGAGEIVAIVGESGSGKTVTGMSVMRLLDARSVKVSDGQVRLRTRDGEVRDLVTLSDTQIRRVRGSEISMIFQDQMTSLNPVFSIGEQIVEGIVYHSGASASEARKQAASLLERVGLGEGERLLKQYPHQLSGGMRQRVMIAIALSSNPQLLIADEPTTALDVTVQAQITDLLKSLAAERGMGVVFITHDLALVAKTADRVCVMYAGEVVEEGLAEQVFKRPRHPYTTALAGCIPHGPSQRRLTPIPGHAPDLSEDFVGCRFAARCQHALPKCTAAPIELRAVGDRRSARCVRAEELT